MQASSLVYVSVGSNIAPHRHIPDALKHLQKQFPVLKTSQFYRTEAINRPDQPPYRNGVWQIRSDCDPLCLKKFLRTVETSCGREKTADKFASRTIDLDILLYDKTQGLPPEGLALPNPDLYERPFLIKCLAEISPALILPDKNMNARQLIKQMPPLALDKDAPLTQLLKAMIQLHKKNTE